MLYVLGHVKGSLCVNMFNDKYEEAPNGDWFRYKIEIIYITTWLYSQTI